MFHNRSKFARFAFQLIAIATASTLLAACASTPPPVLESELARRAVQSASVANAERDAPVEWRLAQELFDQAQAAEAKPDYLLALRLYQQTALRAELARIKARAAQARAEVQRREGEVLQLRADIDEQRKQVQ